MPFRITPAVLNLIIINVLVFLALNIYQDPWFQELFLLYKSDLILPNRLYRVPFGIVDSAEHFKPLQIVTSFFAHMDLLHLFFNMYALFMFGTMLESVLGIRRFIQEYLIYGVASGILITLLDPSPIPVLGASTALSGMLVSFAYRFPDVRLGIMFLPFQFKAIQYVIGLAVISGVLVAYSVIAQRDVGRISHFGHFAGMAVAFVYLYGGRYLRRMNRGR